MTVGEEGSQLVVQGHRDGGRSPVERRAEVSAIGELDASTVGAFEAALHAALADPQVDELVVDTAGLEFIDSVGVRALLVGHEEASARGLRFVLDPASPVVRRVLRLTGLTWLLPPRAAPPLDEGDGEAGSIHPVDPV
jgi:anti-sigma B factor antagonist